MKKLFIALAVAAFCFAACQEKPEEIKTFSATVVLKAEDSTVPMPEKFNVKVTGEGGTEMFNSQVTTTEVTVSGLLSGIYNISVDGTSSDGRYGYLFSGALNSIAITQEGQSVEVTLKVSREQALLFKEIYYVGPSGWKEPGSSDPYKDDNFFEIYNNSSIDVALDGLCIANCAPTTASEILTWDIENADNYVFCLSIWQFPGNGNQYILEAGKSVVLASVPIDHTQKIEGSLDLSSADFEFFVENQNIYADNTSIPNMALKFGKFGNGADRYLPTVMGPAMILFKPEGDIDNSTWVSPRDKDDQCKEIPVAWVIDGVEAVQNEAGIEFKRLPDAIDGGAIYMTEGFEYLPFPDFYPDWYMTRWDHTSVSFSRKYKNGTDITGGLVDTNNSSNDFEAHDAPEIRRGL